MKFFSKASTLYKIDKKIKSASIPKFFFFTVKDYKLNKQKILNQIQKKFSNLIAIRSSSISEDQLSQSMAGYFLSELNISSQNIFELDLSIQKVINSYNKGKYRKKTNHQVLVQEMVTNVYISGVATTADQNTGLPYFCVDYSISNDTTNITSGKDHPKSFIFFQSDKTNKINKAKKFKKVIYLLNDLIRICKNKFLDIEFIIDKKGKLYLLQVRPLLVKNKFKYDINEILIYFNRLRLKIKKLQLRHHNLLGKTTAFGVMPDWNPAEIIGIRPKPLAISIYQEIITDHIWSLQRKAYGYRDVTSHHLLTTFFGIPYIDIRVDFNSWIPEGLSKKTAEKLLNYYINKYKKNLHLHDKIEFDIIFTCLNLSSNKKIAELKKFGFHNNEIIEIKNSLSVVTHKSIQEFNKNEKNLEILSQKFDVVKNSNIYVIDKIYWLIEDCKKYGSLTFAGSARCAFVAVDILNSFLGEGIIDIDQKNNFINSIETITSKITKDYYKLSKKDFIKKHGHLRPNTYDNTSLTYKEGYQIYFSKNKKIENSKKKKFFFDKSQLSKIREKLKKIKLKITPRKLIDFIKESIKQREYSKYLFTRNVSLILDYVNDLAKSNKIIRSDASYLNINTILNMYYNLNYEKVENQLKREINLNKKIYHKQLPVKLPDNIINPYDAYFYESFTIKSNFITTKSAEGNVIELDKNEKQNISNKIILIENADPGYDFLFTKNIKGLITKYGGSNSHMAIRCSELSIPAVIGVGDKNYNKFQKSNSLRIDCKTKTVSSI